MSYSPVQLSLGWSWAQNWAQFFPGFSYKNPTPVGFPFHIFTGSLGPNADRIFAILDSSHAKTRSGAGLEQNRSKLSHRNMSLPLHRSKRFSSQPRSCSNPPIDDLFELSFGLIGKPILGMETKQGQCLDGVVERAEKTGPPRNERVNAVN